MNNYEAKRGFISFIILTVIIIGMSIFVNFIVTQNTSSEIEATSSVISTLPQEDLIMLVGIPIVIIGVIVTVIKQLKRKHL